MTAGQIAAVAPGSLSERVGLRPGDELLSVNGHGLRDVIDVRIYAAEEHLRLLMRRDGVESTSEADRRYGEPLGLTFTAPTFDGIRRCDNRCGFCFVAQAPPGLRPSLNLKDDDYRHSFLFGSYVTLTHMDEADWARIGEQHLSPLYVSIHATDPGLRRSMLRNPSAPDVMAQLRCLADLGIEGHTQIVVVPDVNDGPCLDRSIRDLAGLHPAVLSVSVVPVGLTRFHRGGRRTHTEAQMRAVFDQVTAWQARLLPQLGVRFAYLSDEWYLRLDEGVPTKREYDRLDLAENGVGLVREFLEARDWGLEIGDLGRHSLGLVTGTLFAPVLRRVTAASGNVTVVPVVNRFFGETVTVAGLLTGQDVVAREMPWCSRLRCLAGPKDSRWTKCGHRKWRTPLVARWWFGLSDLGWTPRGRTG